MLAARVSGCVSLAWVRESGSGGGVSVLAGRVAGSPLGRLETLRFWVVDNPELSDPTSRIDRMSSVVEIGGASAAVAGAHELLDGLLAADLSLGTDDELLEVLREVERLSRRLAAVGYALIVEAQARCLPHSRGAASMAVLLRDLLRDLLRLHPAEARARVRAAEAAGPRRALSGEALDPVYPDVGAAQVAGEISAEHARVIVRAVEALPAAVQAVHGVAVERELLGYARTLDPQYLHRAALTIHDRLNPDGYLHDSKDRDRKRDLTVQARPNGSAGVRGELTPECTQRLLGLFDALAARPVPAEWRGAGPPGRRGSGATTRCSTRCSTR